MECHYCKGLIRAGSAAVRFHELHFHKLCFHTLYGDMELDSDRDNDVPSVQINVTGLRQTDDLGIR